MHWLTLPPKHDIPEPHADGAAQVKQPVASWVHVWMLKLSAQRCAPAVVQELVALHEVQAPALQNF